MNPSNTSESNLPTMVEPPSLPVKAAISPEEMGKALQLRHENRLTVRKPILPDLLETQTDGGYKEPIRLNFDDEIEPGKRKMNYGASGRLVGRAVGAVLATASMAAHAKVREVEDENAGVKGAHKTETMAELSVRSAARSYNRKRQQYRNRLRDEPLYSDKNRQRTSEKPNQSGNGGTHTDKGSTHKSGAKTDTKKLQQKTQIKREYQLAARSKAKGGTSAASKGAKKAVGNKVDKAKELVKTFLRNNKGLFYVLAGLGVLFVLMMVGLGSCSSMIAGTSTPIITTTYPSSDEEIYAVEDAYIALEEALNRQINRMERTYPGYDEYNYQVDEISHNPYHLISYLSVKYGEFTLADVQSELSILFSSQYQLSVTETVEIRTRTETRIGTATYTDPDTGETIVEEYEYEVEVAYEYYILNIKLTNRGFDAAARGLLNDEEKQLYTLYNYTYGNRDYLFDVATLPVSDSSYEIPTEALSDVRFANMIEEAEKYLGYPYVWGGASPSTSFDCSGFVSYVINNCGNGWSYGRLTADGLSRITRRVSPENAKPGDLIFFQGTYDTTGASHVGIYVGDGMMIHCGNPIQYTSIKTSYWQSHFYHFGRLP